MRNTIRLLLFILFLMIAGLFLNPAYAQSGNGNCRNDPYPPPSAPVNASYKFVWSADCESEKSKSCLINDDCPKTTNDSKVTAATSSWCYKFEEGNRCIQLKTRKLEKSKTEERRKNMEKYLKNIQNKFSKINNALLKTYVTKANQVLNAGVTEAVACVEKINNQAADREDCKQQVKKTYGMAKAAYRLVKYQAIVAGNPNTCVEADLGSTPRLEAKGITKIQEKDLDNPKETGKSATSRLFLCNGADGKMKWRIFYDSNLLRIIPEDVTRLNLTEDINNLPNKGQLSSIKQMLGVK